MRRRLTCAQLRDAIESYFADEGSVKSMAGLAVFLGLDSDRLNGLLSDASSPLQPLLSLAKTRIEKEICENALKGRYNATMSSFLLKTCFGYSEKAAPPPPVGVRVELAEELQSYAV